MLKNSPSGENSSLYDRSYIVRLTLEHNNFTYLYQDSSIEHSQHIDSIRLALLLSEAGTMEKGPPPPGCTAWASYPNSNCSPASRSGFGHPPYDAPALAARNFTDPTGRIVIETIPYSVARFHYGAWIGMSILASVLLILCALFAGLTLGVCGLDKTLLQLRCITGTPKERYEDVLCAFDDPADHHEGGMPVWSLA